MGPTNGINLSCKESVSYTLKHFSIVRCFGQDTTGHFPVVILMQTVHHGWRIFNSGGGVYQQVRTEETSNITRGKLIEDDRSGFLYHYFDSASIISVLLLSTFSYLWTKRYFLQKYKHEAAFQQMNIERFHLIWCQAWRTTTCYKDSKSLSFKHVHRNQCTFLKRKKGELIREKFHWQS